MKKYLEFINKNRQRFLNELREYIEIESTALNKKGIETIVSKLFQRIKDLGAKVKIVKIKDSNPFILAEIGNGKKTLLIYDHYDVMPASINDGWLYPPFQLTIKGKQLFGRGLADNKGHLTLRLQAIETVLKNIDQIPIKIKLVIEGEEEIGSPHIHEFSDKYRDFLSKADLCLWESGDVDDKGAPQMFLGMKGIAYFLLSSKMGKSDLHSGYASLVDSAVWRLIYALKSLRNDQGEVLITDLINEIEPPDKFNMQLIKKYPWSKEEVLKSLGRKKFLNNQNKKEKILQRHYFGVTCNICGIWAGSTGQNELKTVLPNSAFAKIDFRLVNNIDSKKVKKYLLDHLKNNGFGDIKVQEIINEPVATTDHNNGNFKKAVSIIEKSYNKKVTITPYAKGSGPMYYIASRFNVPAIQLGAQTLDSNIHGQNENITIDNYFNALKATVELILKL